MKLAQMPNLTYFPPEQRTGDSFTEYGMRISFRKKKKGRKKEREERKEEGREENGGRKGHSVRYSQGFCYKKNHSFSEYLSYFSFTEKIKNAPQTKLNIDFVFFVIALCICLSLMDPYGSSTLPTELQKFFFTFS